MIDNTKWPKESQELAESILPDSLKRLLMQLDVYMLLSPYDPDNRVTYTVEMSNIFLDIGRCEITALVADNIYVLNHVQHVTELMTNLLNHIDYTDTRDKLIGMTRTLRDIIFSLNEARAGGLVSMGDYKTE
jgi:hypothetical protein